MSEFISAFKEVAEKVTRDCPSNKCEWTSEPNKPKETLTIHKLDENGFDVRLECESYGLYPFAGGWHGAPWDVTITSLDEFKKDAESFMRSILSPSSQLRIRYTNGRAYRWMLSYTLLGKPQIEEVGLFFYNYFGAKSERCFSNTHLPPNKSSERTR